MTTTQKIGSGKPLFELPNDRFMDAAGQRLVFTGCVGQGFVHDRAGNRQPIGASHDPRHPLPDHLGTTDWEDADQ